MALTSTSFKRHGFTLVEMLVTLAISTIIMAGVTTGYFMISRQFRAIANYWDIHTEGRFAIDRFGADIRQVSAITSFATNGPVIVTIPVTFANNGAALSNKTVTYSFNNFALSRFDSSTGKSRMLATNVYSLTFRMFDRLGNNTPVIANSKALQLELYFRKTTGNQRQTEDYLSARLDMRNKP